MYKEKHIKIPIDQNEYVTGIFSYSDSNSKDEAWLLLHGISTDKNEYLDFFKTLSISLVNNGQNTLRIDFRGHGDSKIHPKSFTIASQLIYIVRSLGWLKENGSSIISLIAASFGAPPSIFASCLLPSSIKSLFLISPVLDYKRSFLMPENEWALSLFKDISTATLVHNQSVPMTENFAIYPELVAEMNLIQIEYFINACNKTIHIIHGNKDSMIDFEISKEMAIKYEHVKLFEFEDMEHGFTNFEDDEGKTSDTENNIKNILKILIDSNEH